MPKMILESTHALAELEQLLEEINDPAFVYWPARKRVRRGVFLARAVLYGLLFHLNQWDDYFPPGAEYGIYDPPTPDEAELQRARVLMKQLEAREQALLAARHRQQALYYIRAYHEQAWWHSRHRLSLASVPMHALPAELLDLHDLEYLSLDSCGLNDLRGIGQLQRLRHLSVSYNALERLPDDFAQLQQLEWFSAKKNRLSSIEVVFSLPRLQWLMLKHNPLSPDDKARLRATGAYVYLELDP